MTGQYEWQQQIPLQNAQFSGQINPQALVQQPFGQQGYATQGQISGLGQGALGQPYGQFGGQQSGQHFGALGPMGGVGMQSPWALQQRQLSPHDANEVIRQLVPLLPHIIAQAQQWHPQAAFGYGQRTLTQHDVNEVVRQILPFVPQIVAQLQGQSPVHAVHHQHPVGQQAWPQVQAAFGAIQPGLGQLHRQLTQQDVSEVVRQLAGIIPQVIQQLQATSQQRWT
jgi:hypothetical protein